MITAKPLPAKQPGWQALWREAIRDPHELLRVLGLESIGERLGAQAHRDFPMRVPRGFVARMAHGDPHDPLLRQVLPLADEELRVTGFGVDAVGDLDAREATGVLHKYHGRALLIATGSCAIHCRYCFRRHFPYAEQTAASGSWAHASATLAADPDLHEVILSGGDPLALSTAKLAQLTEQLREFGQLRRLRIHSRLPVVLPERVDDELLAWLGQLPWQCVLVIHANHANEIDAAVLDACVALRAAGVSVLNQSVLLKGVNDSATSLIALSERLFEAGVLPYYLHQLDRVHGAAHFEVDDRCALELHAHLSARLPGYLVPRLVREVAGAPAKLAVSSVG